MKQGLSHRTPRLLAAGLGALLTWPSAFAQSQAPSLLVPPTLVSPATSPLATQPTPAAATSGSKAEPQTAAPAASAPRRVRLPPAPTQATVIEDDSTRIEELRVNGQTERVVVKSKRVNMPAWEIRPVAPGRTGAVDARLPNDSANPRVWSVFSF